MATVVTFPLAGPAAAAAAAAAAETGTAGPFSLRGIVTPFGRDQKNDFANAVGLDLILSNVRQVLGTKKGELRWNTDFGSLLHTLRHRNNKVVLDELAHVFVVEALRRWEPRVRVTRVRVARTRGQREAEITVLFNVVDLNAPVTTVLALNQSTTLPFQLAA